MISSPVKQGAMLDEEGSDTQLLGLHTSKSPRLVPRLKGKKSFEQRTTEEFPAFDGLFIDAKHQSGVQSRHWMTV